MRAGLLVVIARANVPGFTANFRVTDSSQAATLNELLWVADMALFQARREDRNQVVSHGDTATTDRSTDLDLQPDARG